MILVISTPRDDHAQAMMAELLRRRAPARLLDLSDFPQRLGLAMRYEGSVRRFRIGCRDVALDLDSCGAAWWRRPQTPEVSADIVRSSHRFFALNESVEALQGLWQCLDTFWVNDPAREAVAQRKAYQLRIAQEVGLEVPETLITNCVCDAQDFVGLRGAEQVIFKAFSATEQEWRETRLVRAEEVGFLANVKYAPVIFQQYVEADVDVRATVVGERVFAAAIHSQETTYPVDFRMDWGRARVEALTLPAEVERALLAFMGRLGLVYGAIDLRRTPDGRYVFLEVNPSGQWRFIEQRTGQAIGGALAELLASEDRRVR